MKKQLRILSIILAILVLVAIALATLLLWLFSEPHPYVPTQVYSPDGSKVIIPTINFNKEVYDTYLLIHIKIQDTESGETLFHIQTRASDRMRWSVAWIGEDIVLLDSSDLGSYCWKEVDGNWRETKCP